MHKTLTLIVVKLRIIYKILFKERSIYLKIIFNEYLKYKIYT